MVARAPPTEYERSKAVGMTREEEELFWAELEADIIRDLGEPAPITDAEIEDRLTYWSKIEGWDACAWCGSRDAKREDAGDPNSLRLCFDCWIKEGLR